MKSLLNQEPWIVNRPFRKYSDVWSYLSLAAFKRFVQVAAALIAAGADVNLCIEKTTPLRLACMAGDKQMVQLLLAQPHIVVDVLGTHRVTPLGYASAHADILQMLLDANANVAHVNDYGNTPLMSAAAAGSAASIELLLQHKANVHHRNWISMCSLSTAARVGNADAVGALLKANAAVDSIDVDGYTPLMHAAEKSREAIVKLLLAVGADVNAVTKARERPSDRYSPLPTVAPTPIPDERGVNGRTALTLACNSGNGNCVPHLLDAKADINQVDVFGFSVLYAAVAEKNVTAAKLLLERGAVCSTERFNAKALVSKDNAEMRALFDCTLCGWEGMCCANCRKKYCVGRCAKCNCKIFLVFIACC